MQGQGQPRFVTIQWQTGAGLEFLAMKANLTFVMAFNPRPISHDRSKTGSTARRSTPGSRVLFPWAFLILLILSPWVGRAQTDGRFQISLDTNRLPLSSSGLTLTTNLSLQLGTFTNSTNALDVVALIRGQTNRAQIIADLTNQFQVLFSTNRATNVTIAASILTLPTNIAIGGVSRSNDIPVYVLVFNHTNPASATEMGVFRALSTSTNSQTNAFFPSNNVRGRVFLSGGDKISNTNTALKLGMGVLFGDAKDGRLRLAPIGPPERMVETSLTAFVGLDAQLSLRANNGPTAFSVVVSNGGATSSLSTLGLTNSNGVLVGVPLPGAAGTNTLAVTASNGDGFAADVAASVSLVVRAQNGPNFTNAPVSTNTAGVSTGFTFQTDATNPATLVFTNLDPLPAGLVLSSSGVLSGTNTAPGTNTFRVLVTDTNSGELRALNFQLVTASPQIFISGTNSSGELEAVAGEIPFTNALSYTPGYLPQTITTLPGGTFAGLTVATNFLSGTSAPSAMSLADPPLTSTIRMTDTNTGVTAQTQVRIVFVNAPPTLATNQFTWILGTTTNQMVTASGNPTFSATGLPPVATNGISTNGLIEITTSPAVLTNLTQAIWTSTIVADNSGGAFRGGGRTTSSVVITLTNPIPAITSTNRVLLSAGKATTYTLTATGNPSVFEFLDPLPAGLSALGEKIQGIPTEGGLKVIRCRVSNFGLPGDSGSLQTAQINLNLFVAANRPTTVAFSSPSNLVVGNPLPPGGSDFIDTSGGVNVSAFGLPPGLSVDRTTGKLTGTPTTPGTYSATVFIQNGKGWIKKTVPLTVR